MQENNCFVSPISGLGRFVRVDYSSSSSKSRRLKKNYAPSRSVHVTHFKHMTCTCHDHCRVSRRKFVTQSAASVFATICHPLSSRAQPPPQRTIFDEERERSEKAKKEAEEARISALRVGFEAVEKASAQLDDLQSLANEENWDGIRQFTRLFNNSVEREGMEAIANALNMKTDRKAALAVGRKLTDTLILIDRCARDKNKESALVHVQEARDIVISFQTFKP